MKLTLLEKEDYPKIIEWNIDKSSDYLIQWAGTKFSWPLTLIQIENYFSDETKKDNSNIYVYKIVLIDSDEMIGTVELREVDKNSKVGRICRFLIGEEKNRGKNIGTIVLNEVLKIGFEDMEFEKITLGVFDFNQGAIKCYEKVGFVKEKFLENLIKSSSDYWNLYEMGISKLEWRSK